MDELRGALPGPENYLQTLVDSSASTTALWMVIATALVMFMQAGFLLLEAGSMRSKNTVSVAQKNVTDMIIAGCVFLTLGATIMFGIGETGFFGFGGFAFSDPIHQPMLIFQFGFCAAAATIVSGAIGERMSFRAYMLLSLLIATMVYPMFGRIVWGNLLIEDNPTFLADIGFLDYAGGTVVHVVGGAAALAACIVLGARTGRFDAAGRPAAMPGHSSVLSLLGVLILAVSWIGFNAGTAPPGSNAFTNIVVNTIVALCFGGLAALLWDLITNPRAMQPRTSASGILGGLVAVTAGCAYVDFFGAIALGFGGGMVATFGSEILLKKFKLDDPVDAIATHLLAGAYGTMMLAFVALPEHVTDTRLAMFATQALGVGMAVAWAFCTVFVALHVMKRFFAIRVTPEEERIGLNLAEHNAVFDTEQLLNLMKDNKDVPERTEVISETPGDLTESDTSIVSRLVSATTQAQQHLAAKAQQLDDYEKVGTDWMWETDENLNISYLSQKFYNEMGDKANAFIGKPYASFLRQYKVPVQQHLAALEKHAVFDDVIFEIIGQDGVTRMFSLSGIPRFDVEGQFIGYRGRALDVSEKLRADDEIRFLAHHDHLTGLSNRASFNKMAAKMLSDPRVVAHGAAVMSLDLDGFKAVNDSFGHTVGDALLQVIAGRIKDTMPENSVIGRFGGDEFVIAMPLGPHGSADLEMAARGIVASISQIIELGELQIQVGVSIGSAKLPQDANDLSTLIQFSDMALYEAKASQNERWIAFTPEMHRRLKRRQRLESEMSAAIKNGEFFTVYQPQLDLKDRSLTGFEALVRWHHPELGHLSPVEFIPIAEDTGVITELGHFVLLDACRTATQWPSINGRQLLISVNVSPQQFFNQDLPSIIASALEETGLAATRLEIEITEGTLVRDADVAIEILTTLRKMGVRIAVDDFGTGYSSLSYLQKFPLDRLKIDRAFVREIEKNTNDQRITSAIVDLGRTLGLNVIAEGVETKAQFKTLADMACDEMQGYLFSAPVSALKSMQIIDDAMAGNRMNVDEDAEDQALETA